MVSSAAHMARFSTVGRQNMANQDWYDTPKIQLLAIGGTSQIDDKVSSSNGRGNNTRSKNEHVLT